MGMRLICDRCRTRFKVVQVGVPVLETAGKEQRPYQLWQADLLRCACNRTVLRTADNPAARDAEAGAQARAVKALGKKELYYEHEFQRDVSLDEGA